LFFVGKKTPFFQPDVFVEKLPRDVWETFRKQPEGYECVQGVSFQW